MKERFKLQKMKRCHSHLIYDEYSKKNKSNKRTCNVIIISLINFVQVKIMSLEFLLIFLCCLSAVSSKYTNSY